nr:unnamed protein product [Callosobruchus chinensis]
MSIKSIPSNGIRESINSFSLYPEKLVAVNVLVSPSVILETIVALDERGCKLKTVKYYLQQIPPSDSELAREAAFYIL